MNISSVSEWSNCEKMALYHTQARVHQAMTAAAWVGVLTHANVMRRCGLSDKRPNPPRAMRWDNLTRDRREAAQQAKDCAAAICQQIELHELEPIAGEVPVEGAGIKGRIDLIVNRRYHGELIIDLKTGEGGAGWLQLGGYLTALALGEEQKFCDAGIIRARRRRINQLVAAETTLRGGYDLRAGFAHWHTRINQIIGGAEPTRSPGSYCRRCQVLECAVGNR